MRLELVRIRKYPAANRRGETSTVPVGHFQALHKKGREVCYLYLLDKRRCGTCTEYLPNTVPTEYLYRVLGFLSSRPNWVSLPPHLQASVVPPPPPRLVQGGDTLACRGRDADPGFRIPDLGSRISDPLYRISDPGSLTPDLGSRISEENK